MKKIAYAVLGMGLLANTAFAKTFNLPTTDESLIGRIQYTTDAGVSTSALAHHFNLGQNTVISANPGAVENGLLPKAVATTVPTQFLLPPMRREGIIINLPEMRMYYFPKNSNTVMTFPIGIGKIGKTTPIRDTAIARKMVNPSWTPPEDIREFNRQQGIELPKTMGPGPDNPLGPYAIYLKIPTYLIHSTIFPESIGRRASFGCIRMHEDDIKEFFPVVQAGTPVVIVDMPIKVAWNNNQLYVETHPQLEEKGSSDTSINTMVNAVEQRIPNNDHVVLVNWPMLAYLSEQPDGIPHEVGVKVR